VSVSDGTELHRKRHTPTRILLGVLTSLVSVNLWTGGPILALWVGSRVQESEGTLTMRAVGATIGVLIAITFLLYRTLVFLQGRYNAVLGEQEGPRRQTAWLKPMSGERRSLSVRRPLSTVERVTVWSVVSAVLVFEVWFFFFAHTKLAG
jgi:hypothetical protein